MKIGIPTGEELLTHEFLATSSQAFRDSQTILKNIVEETERMEKLERQSKSTDETIISSHVSGIQNFKPPTPHAINTKFTQGKT